MVSPNAATAARAPALPTNPPTLKPSVKAGICRSAISPLRTRLCECWYKAGAQAAADSGKQRRLGRCWHCCRRQSAVAVWAMLMPIPAALGGKPASGFGGSRDFLGVFLGDRTNFASGDISEREQLLTSRLPAVMARLPSLSSVDGRDMYAACDAASAAAASYKGSLPDLFMAFGLGDAPSIFSECWRTSSLS